MWGFCGVKIAEGDVNGRMRDGEGGGGVGVGGRGLSLFVFSYINVYKSLVPC